MSIVVPAVLPSSQKDLEDTLSRVVRLPSVSRIQIDVVDGRVATPASWPYTAPKEMSDRVARGEMLPDLDRVEYEIDLMCFDAADAAGPWLALGATRLTFHVESSANLPAFLASVRERYGADGITFGLALPVQADIALLETSLDQISYVQFMGIATIGRQGQPFDSRVLEKVRSFHRRNPDVPMQVDGGVSLAHAKELLMLGVSNLVVGSAILRANDPASELEKFEALRNPFSI